MKSGDRYLVRWDHPAGLAGFIALKAGTVVVLLQYYREIKDKTTTAKHVAHVKAIINRGFVRAAYLEPIDSIGFPKSDAGRLFLRHFEIHPSLWDCRWYLGVSNPVYAGVRLRADSTAPAGSFVVLVQSECDTKYQKKWRGYLIAVKTYSGPTASFAAQQKRDDLHAKFYNNTPATNQNRKAVDFLFGGDGIAYVPIRRSKTGKFFISKVDKAFFSSIFALLSFYMGRRIPLKAGPPLTLTQPFQLLDQSVRGPVPHIAGKDGHVYKQPANCNGLFTHNQTNKRYMTSFEIDRNCSSMNGRTYYGTVRYGRQFSQAAAVKLLNKYWFDPYAFSADLAKLKLDERSKNVTLHHNHRDRYFMHGAEYLTQIVSHSEPAKINAPFVAYELVPNITLFTALRGGRHFGPRAILEIMFQVTAAMAHLEMNGLCHRGLCTANVMLHWDDELSTSIKVTDYMLPYHHLVAAGPSDYDGTKANDSAIKDLRWQWMSPESLFHGVFDSVADMWSFGALIFELVNGAKIPYTYEHPPIKSADDLKAFILEKKTMTLSPTFQGPELIQTIFSNCFEARTDRITFERLVHILQAALFDHVVQEVKKA
uniref:Protein kinase domain-containing protein n=1 Tax=Panagrellus redivivus TaxID=6233 RepID=A0A7E4W0N8_PANRE